MGTVVVVGRLLMNAFERRSPKLQKQRQMAKQHHQQQRTEQFELEDANHGSRTQGEVQLVEGGPSHRSSQSAVHAKKIRKDAAAEGQEEGTTTELSTISPEVDVSQN